MSKLVHFLKRQDGVTAIEYALIAGVTGLVLIAVLPALESGLSTIFTSLANGM